MTTRLASIEPRIEPTVRRDGAVGRASRTLAVCSAALTGALAVLAFGMAITTPPRSGPFCASDCVTYPYTDVAAFVPRDYLWMYPAVLMVVSYIVLMACLHEYAPPGRNVFARLGLSFAILAAGALVTDYVLQLALVQPSLLRGETAGLSIISQYNPHGLSIVLEDVGYLCMGASFLFAGAVLAGRGRLERAVRWTFRAAGLLTLLALVGLSVAYGADLEYRFEVAAIAINWTALILLGPLLSVRFRQPC